MSANDEGFNLSERQTTPNMRTLGAVIVWHRPVTIKCDANLASLRLLALLAVQLRGIGMSEDDTVPDAAAQSGGGAFNNEIQI